MQHFLFDLFALLARTVKNLVRRAHFCFFKQNFERKKFPAFNQNFPVSIEERKKRLDERTLYTICKHGIVTGPTSAFAFAGWDFLAPKLVGTS